MKLEALAQARWICLKCDCKRVGDDAAPVLASFRSLRAVDLTGTSFTEKGVAALRQAKPDCKIVTGRATGNEPKAEEPEP